MPDETPLTAVPDIPAGLLKQLHHRWIQSAEQLVALGATSDGVRSLARELGIENDQASRLIASARAALPPEKADELSRPVDAGKYPLGALPPKRGPEPTHD
jgi:hypothetical protein